MKVLNLALLSFFLFLISLSARADFSNMAKLSVNGVLVRRIIDNSTTPHLVNLSKFKVGDTLKIDLWTDHGAENNAFVRIIDLETEQIDTLGRRKTFIITSDFLNHAHLISATYIYDHREEFRITSDLFQTTQSNQIELIHQSLDDFATTILDAQSKKAKLTSEIFPASVEVNFIPGNKTRDRKLSDSTDQSIKKLKEFLWLNVVEVDYFDGFSGFDYFKIYNLGSIIYGSLKIDPENLDEYQFTLGDWDYRMEFHFSYTGSEYQLSKILLQLKY